jgi:hypothetical protein
MTFDEWWDGPGGMLDGTSIKACMKAAWVAGRVADLPEVSDEAIEAAAMEFGRTAYNGYPGPGPRSQFCDGAKWARAKVSE